MRNVSIDLDDFMPPAGEVAPIDQPTKDTTPPDWGEGFQRTVLACAIAVDGFPDVPADLFGGGATVSPRQRIARLIADYRKDYGKPTVEVIDKLVRDERLSDAVRTVVNREWNWIGSTEVPENPTFVAEQVRRWSEYEQFRRALIGAADVLALGPDRLDDARKVVAAATRIEVTAVKSVLVNLGDVASENVTWLWSGRIALGKIALVIGEPAAGKSWATHDIAARVTVGATWPDGGIAPQGGVLILSSEDGPGDTVRPAIERQGGDARRVSMLSGVRGGGQECPFNLERDLPVLEEAIDTTRAKLVIFSPLSAYLGRRDSYKDAEMRKVLDPLAALAERTSVAVVGIMHLTKAQQSKLKLRVLGSVAFAAAARTVLAVGEDPGQPGRRYLTSVKNGFGTLAAPLAFSISDTGLAWDSRPVEGTAEQLLSSDEVPTRSEQRALDQARTFLRVELADNPVPSKIVLADARANAISQRTLQRAKADLGVDAVQLMGGGAGRQWYWRLPRGEGRRLTADRGSRDRA